MVETKRLRDMLSFVVDNRGRTCPTAEEGIPLIATNCVKNSTLYPVFEKVRYVDDRTYADWFRAHPQPGDLIFVLKGTPGQVCLTPDPVSFCIAQDMVALRANAEVVDPSYLFAALRSPRVQAGIDNLHVGSMIAHFKKGDFDRLEIPLPDRKTQEKIGGLYLRISEKIEQNTKTAATLEEMARALYRSWFVDFDPVWAKTEGRTPAHMDEATAALFPNSFGDDGLPVGWLSIRADEAVKLTKGRSYKSSELQPSQVALVSLKSFQRKGGYRADGLKSYTGEYKPAQVVLPGELVISLTDVTQAAELIARATYVRASSDFKVLVASLDVGIIRPINEERTPPEFLYQTFNSDGFLNHALAHTSGTTVLHLAKEAIPNYEFLLPCSNAVTSFERVTAPMRAKMFLLENESEALSALRDTLLPKLMSGELRAGEAQELISKVA